jgi:hypothetical protein
MLGPHAGSSPLGSNLAVDELVSFKVVEVLSLVVVLPGLPAQELRKIAAKAIDKPLKKYFLILSEIL